MHLYHLHSPPQNRSTTTKYRKRLAPQTSDCSTRGESDRKTACKWRSNIDENNLNTGNPETTFCQRRNKVQGCASIRDDGKAEIEDGSSEARKDRASDSTDMPRRSARIQARRT
uniref:Uncharacterized protein n=1 Tax=Caenorhabditis japonica TaxID=281687 RepID=A0A8R1EKZ6_CAEJA